MRGGRRSSTLFRDPGTLTVLRLSSWLSIQPTLGNGPHTKHLVTWIKMASALKEQSDGQL